jgi:hypothetical protein
MNRRTAIVVAALLGLAIHSGASAQSTTIYMTQLAPYADARQIDKAVLAECPLPVQQAELIVAQAAKAGITVVRDDAAAKAGKGRVLQVEIVNAVSLGNAFTGHRKQVSIKGRLLEDGKEIGDFAGKRSSGGGAFAGFKGSCAVLGRCVQTLASDVTQWLKNPAKDSRIGE